jgi:signal peptidase I
MEGADGIGSRSLGARIGIAALNLLTPGLGLLRLGRLRPGLAFALSGVAITGLAALASMGLPTLTSEVCFAIFVLALPVGLSLLLAPMIMGWRPSRTKGWSMPWWSKWYSLTALVLIMQVATSFGLKIVHGFYRPFYIPSEAMRPTLEVGDRLVADMRDRAMPKRGDVIAFRVGSSIYIKRIVGLPGDRVEMRDGIPFVNGHSASQRQVANRTIHELGEMYVAGILVERLPGVEGEHRILDMGESRADEMAPVRVPAGHLFVLGDNRDRSADSRISREEGGFEMLPVADIAGRPLFKTWTTDGGVHWLGTPIR